MTVYICYCYADTHLASKLALDLMRRGLNVWIDQSAEGTSPETRRLDQIQGIVESDHFVLVLSATTTTSAETFDQVRVAVERNARSSWRVANRCICCAIKSRSWRARPCWTSAAPTTSKPCAS